jgi:superfamily II DNA/RNA helicase
MFDPNTVQLMSRAPTLEGLDLAALPQQLTDAYAQIVSERIRLRELAETTPEHSELDRTIQRLRRLAFTNEALVSALPNRDDRQAAAFVGGAAHHACLMADHLRGRSQQLRHLTVDSISPEVSATLLFLISESTADAAELAKRIDVSGDDPIERLLLEGVVALANGRLRPIVDAALPMLAPDRQAPLATRGFRALLHLSLQGVRALARQLLGSEDEPDGSDARQIFQEVITLCQDSLPAVSQSAMRPPLNVYPGPLHLASLLYAAANELGRAALANLPPPTGIDGAGWVKLLRDIAVKRPYLWRNHREAIAAGYLEPGTSSAISFPTGAGKSTLAELKIASTLLLGRKVIFLAPTLSLVDQTARALESTFPATKVEREEFSDLSFADAWVEQLPSISVMTPERCLATLGFNRELFEDVGLLVFDECHLMHPRQSDGSRRAIDSMLCLLNLTATSPQADLLLLSAMMKNAGELSAWAAELTGRPCLPLTLTWKPTRQVRGCVVYSADEISVLNERLLKSKQTSSTKNAPAATLRQLNAIPHGFFSLRQTWQSRKRDDYALLRLLDDPVQLSTGTSAQGKWYLTPNGNAVAAALAAASSRQGMKTLVFAQTIRFCTSASKQINHELGAARIQLTPDELQLFRAAVQEIGGAQHLYLEVDKHGTLASSSASHHGLLLVPERHLHESLFRRRDGIQVLVATSTLAQGMNLPSEVVIIGGDSRFDQAANKMERLEAQELLNAAGRAGRAGESAYGFVLLVPSKVVDFNESERKIHGHWMELQAIFEQSDQCLDIDDPIAPILDRIHSASSDDDLARYFLSRLPVDPGDSDVGESHASKLLSRSFGAFRARQRSEPEWVQSRIKATIAARKVFLERRERLSWSDQLSASTGVSADVLIGIAMALPPTSEFGSRTTRQWGKWFFDLLAANPAWLHHLFRPASLEELLGAQFNKLSDDADRSELAIPVLRRLLGKWLAGKTLAEIEEAFGTLASKIGKCKNAREFVLRTVPELAYAFGLPGLVARASQDDLEESTTLAATLMTLGSCVREGLDSPEKLALRQLKPRSMTRVGVHLEFERVSPHVGEAPEGEDFDGTMVRIRHAVRAARAS